MRLIDADKYCDFLNTYPLEKAQNNFMSFYREALQNTFEFEVKAITIEWLEKYLHELNKQAEEEMDFIINELGGYETCHKMEFVIGIEKMLEKWEKENELDKVQ